VKGTKAKVLEVLGAVPKGVVRYSTTDWHRVLGEDKREIRAALEELEAEAKIEIAKGGRPDKPLYKLG
jgi:hypothetical protein